MNRAKNGSIPAIANAITPMRRRVLWELARLTRPATTEELHLELHTSAFMNARGPARKPRWPGGALNWLQAYGCVEHRSALVDQWHYDFWSVTSLGKSVARLCYMDGGVAES